MKTKPILLGDEQVAALWLPEAEKMIARLDKQQRVGIEVWTQRKRIRTAQNDLIIILAQHQRKIGLSRITIIAQVDREKGIFDLSYRNITLQTIDNDGVENNIMEFFGYVFDKAEEKPLRNIAFEEFLPLSQAASPSINMTRYYDNKISLAIFQRGLAKQYLPLEIIYQASEGKLKPQSKAQRPPIDTEIEGYNADHTWLQIYSDNGDYYRNTSSQGIIEGPNGIQYVVCDRDGGVGEILDWKAVFLRRDITQPVLDNPEIDQLPDGKFREFYRMPITDDTQEFYQAVAAFPLQINPVWYSPDNEYQDWMVNFPPAHFLLSSQYAAASKDALLIKSLGRSWSSINGGNYYSYTEIWRFDELGAQRQFGWTERDPFVPGNYREILMNFLFVPDDSESGLLVKVTQDADGNFGDRFMLYVNSSPGYFDNPVLIVDGKLSEIMGYEAPREANDTFGYSNYWVDGWKIGPGEYGFKYANNDNSDTYFNKYQDAFLHWLNGEWTVVHAPPKERSLTSFFEVNQFRPWEVAFLETDRPLQYNVRGRAEFKVLDMRTGEITSIKETDDWWDNANTARFRERKV